MKLPHPRGTVKIPSRSDWIIKVANIFIAAIGMDIAGTQVFRMEKAANFQMSLRYVMANMLFVLFFSITLLGIIDVYRTGKFVCDGALINRNNGEEKQG